MKWRFLNYQGSGGDDSRKKPGVKNRGIIPLKVHGAYYNTEQETDMFYLRLLHTYHQSKQYIFFNYKSLSEEIKWQSASSQPYI
jgi:hypothetical protein